MAIAHQIREVKYAIEKREEEIALGKDMQDLLRDYNWKEDEAKVYSAEYRAPVGLGGIFDSMT